jgi:arylsulfatase
MIYTFDKANAEAPSRRQTQYFEMGAYRGIYHDGWYAATTPPITPWSPVMDAKLPDVVTGYQWELYDLQKDFTQSDDVAAQHPAKLTELQAVFDREARKYQVYPLDNRAFARFSTPRPSATAGRSEFVYRDVISGIPAANAPTLLGRSFSITAEIQVPDSGAEGMIVTQGGETSGYGLYLLGSKPVFTYNLLDMQRSRWEGPALTPGRHEIVFDFTYNSPGAGKGGKGVLSVDGREVDRHDLVRTIPFTMPFDETFDVGIDTRTGVNDADYAIPFKFTGKIGKLTVRVGEQQLFPGR